MSEENLQYRVVVNHEEQYSIWPVDQDIPLGWKDAGKSGTKEECLAYVKEVWTDMRPLSLRKKMEELAKQPPPEPVEAEEDEGPSLVERLEQGEHPVEVTLRPEKTVDAFKACLDRGYVHIKFTDTRGGTELGVRLDPDASDLSKLDFQARRGTAHLVGSLTLDFTSVRCIADIDLSTLSGTGRLERVAA